MTTLHLHVPVTDPSAWKAGFTEHAETRRRAGVRAEQVRHLEGDESTIIVDLDFDTASEASSFLDYLRDNIWKDQPILAGRPQATILEPVEVS